MTTKNWLYGNAWERFPIKPGEVWTAEGQGKVYCQDLFNDDIFNFLSKLPPIDVLYVDPPWNTGLLKGFRTKAKKPLDGETIHTFLTRLVDVMQFVNAKVNYIELVKQHIDD